MLSAQIAASVVLLVCTALLARTFIQLRAAPLGFATDDVTVATVSLPAAAFQTSAERLAFYTRLEDRLAARPGVRHVAGATSPPLQGSAVASIYTTELDDPNAPRMSALDVTSGFFDTLAIPVLAGRPFDRRDSALGAPAVVLNARAAMDLFGGVAPAVGRRVRVDRGPWREVVGVVGNVQSTFFNTLEWQTNPQVYRPAAQAFDRTALSSASFTLYLHVRSNPPLSAAELRQAALAAGSRAAVLEVQRVSAMVADATKQPTFRMTLLLSFGVLSLILAALGVYGLASQSAAEHLRDTAVRLVLGGAPLTVMSALVRRVLMAGIVGLGIGTVASLLAGRALKGLIYGVSTRDGLSLAGVATLLLAVTAVAAWIPARRATRVDPARVLRGD